MKSYLLTIILVSVAMGICEIITPIFKGIEKYVKTISLLIILCAIITPLSQLVTNIDEAIFDDIKNDLIIDEDELKDNYNTLLNDYLHNYSIDELIDELKYILDREFKISAEECEIELSTEVVDGKLKVAYCKILLSGKSIFQNPYTIEEYVNQLLDCRCEVLIKSK